MLDSLSIEQRRDWLKRAGLRARLELVNNSGHA
jgi:hypothetical protein